MDDRSRNTDGITEDRGAFDLTATIRAWRVDLAQRPGFRTDNLEELEAHLRDAVQDLEGRGLSTEEAFRVAARRLGAPAALATEFSNINRHAVWIDRLLWMMIGYVFVTGLLSLQASLTFAVSIPVSLNMSIPGFVLVALWALPLALTGWTLRSIARHGSAPRFLKGLSQRPGSLALLSFAVVVVSNLVRSLAIGYIMGRLPQHLFIAPSLLAGNLLSLVGAMIAVIVILVLARQRLRMAQA